MLLRTLATMGLSFKQRSQHIGLSLPVLAIFLKPVTPKHV